MKKEEKHRNKRYLELCKICEDALKRNPEKGSFYFPDYKDLKIWDTKKSVLTQDEIQRIVKEHEKWMSILKGKKQLQNSMKLKNLAFL